MTVPVAVQESVHQAAPALAIMVTASVCRAATYAVVPCSLKNAVGQIVPAALKTPTTPEEWMRVAHGFVFKQDGISQTVWGLLTGNMC
ncbi:uncharacterized protein LOC135220026 isoform X3 [Macrobrachium nipponense]|uniref:uncharacterized protein LOC135220026 isoform X3 n=1 Tax=Macrobrachium nipponense TaxID=159736 RepID=UPI0030C872A3